MSPPTLLELDLARNRKVYGLFLIGRHCGQFQSCNNETVDRKLLESFVRYAFFCPGIFPPWT